MGINSEYLDLAVGLAVVFFLTSLVVSGLSEGVQWITRSRSKFLWAFLHDLVDPTRTKALPRGRLGVLRLWRKDDKRPVVAGPDDGDDHQREAPADATRGDWPQWVLSRLARALGPVDAPELGGRAKRTAISHIPPATLAQAFLEVFAEIGPERTDSARADLAAAPEGERPAGGSAATTEARELPSAMPDPFPERFAHQRIEIALARLGDAPIGPTSRRIWESVGGQIDDFRIGLEDWFDSEMTRLSGYYKRSIRLLLGLLAVLVAVTANIDSLQLAADLWRNPEGRASLVARADDVVGAPAGGAAAAGPSLERLQRECEEAAPTQEEDIRSVDDAARAFGEVRSCVSGALDDLSGLNVIDRSAWAERQAWLDDWNPSPAPGARAAEWWLHLLGVTATALALVLGAPFWFDLLKRLTGIRKGLVGRT